MPSAQGPQTPVLPDASGCGVRQPLGVQVTLLSPWVLEQEPSPRVARRSVTPASCSTPARPHCHSPAPPPARAPRPCPGPPAPASGPVLRARSTALCRGVRPGAQSGAWHAGRFPRRHHRCHRLREPPGDASGPSLTSRDGPLPTRTGRASPLAPSAVRAQCQQRGEWGTPPGRTRPALRRSRVHWRVLEAHPGLPDTVASSRPAELPLSPAECRVTVRGCSQEASGGGLRGARGPPPHSLRPRRGSTWLSRGLPPTKGRALPSFCLTFASTLRFTSSW